MYTILESLKKVTPQQPPETAPAKPVYESVEARGSIVAGVKDVEQRLREQFEAMKEASYVHKGTYGTEYQGDPDDEDAPKRGRPARGTAKKEKVVRVKGPKGRPKKDPSASAPAQIGNDPFGRVPDKAPKGAKGTVVKGKATQDTNEDLTDESKGLALHKRRGHWLATAGAKKHGYTPADKLSDRDLPNMTTDHPDAPHGQDLLKTRIKHSLGKHPEPALPEAVSTPFASFKKQAKGAGLLRSKTKTKTMESSQRLAKLLIEGVNFTEMIKKKDMTLQEMLAELQSDIQAFKETGHCSELLRDCMEVHSFGKSQLNDATENPMDNDNFPMPLAPAQAPSMMDRAKRMGGHVLNKLGHGSDEDMKADLRRKMGMQEAAELNELARLAGLTVAESNDGNLANNAKPYDAVTQGDVIAGRLGKDAMGGKAEVDEGDMEEAAKYRDPKYKDRLYTQEPRSPEDDYHDLDYYTGKKPDDYAGSKDLIGGGEFDHNDPLQKGFGRYGHDVLDRGPRKGMPSRNHITSLKGSIKAAHGTHSEPNLPEGDMEEGAGVMHFKAQQAKADGKDSFRLGDEEFPVQEGGERTMSRAAKGYEKYGKEGMEALAKAGREGRALDPIRAKYNKYDENMTEGDMEEGNEFSGELAKAKAQHKDSFEVDGKTYPVKEGETCPTCHSEPCCCEDMEEADKELAKLKENCGIVSPIGSMAQDMQQQQGRMSINTTQSSDGTKNINISADGEAADQLMQILKMAGMGGGQPEQHAEVVVTAQPMEAKQYGNTEVTEPEEVLNTPRPDVRGMHRAETVGYADTTDDLNKQKDQDPTTANKAANPKTPKANRVEESHPLEALGAKLMAEYQSIKLAK
jgi:hypothetical protein